MNSGMQSIERSESAGNESSRNGDSVDKIVSVLERSLACASKIFRRAYVWIPERER